MRIRTSSCSLGHPRCQLLFPSDVRCASCVHCQPVAHQCADPRSPQPLPHLHPANTKSINALACTPWPPAVGYRAETKRPLSEFDCLGFSLSYELGGSNILEMLHQAGIPLTWRERRETAGRAWDVPGHGNGGASHPLVFAGAKPRLATSERVQGWWWVSVGTSTIALTPSTLSQTPLPSPTHCRPRSLFAGGPSATSNPEPFSDFFDFFALGDGEELLVEIGACLRGCRSDGLSRDEALFRLATTVRGVYVPQFYEPAEGCGLPLLFCFDVQAVTG